jgi:two-component system response regulator AtoC
MTSAQKARILVVDDESSLRHMLRTLLEKHGYQVREADTGMAALAALEGSSCDMVLCDIKMPELDGPGFLERALTRGYGGPVIMMSAYATIDTAVQCMKQGAHDFISKPFRPEEVLVAIQKADELIRLRQENEHYRQTMTSAPPLHGIVYRSCAMGELLARVTRVASFTTSVLITGESGTGKELVARAIHAASPRASRPFVAVNCGAIPESLLESELFGHVRGAFTDAVADKQGLFEEADSGTLFLDEIGEMPVSLQVKLLRVLQDGQIRRVGASTSRKVDVRVISATSRDLGEALAAGTFREDLYFRLNVFSLFIPPLRERPEDVGILAEHFLVVHQARYGRHGIHFSDESLRILLRHMWPGNVRELQNAVERALVLCDGLTILPEHVSELVVNSLGQSQLPGLPPGTLSIKKAEELMERQLIRRALDQTGGNRTHAARLLEISLRSLIYKLKEYGME